MSIGTMTSTRTVWIDPSSHDGLADTPIEQRDPTEVTHATAWLNGRQIEPRLASPGTEAANLAFDVTPARLVTGIITERGICDASEEAIPALFPEFAVVSSG